MVPRDVPIIMGERYPRLCASGTKHDSVSFRPFTNVLIARHTPRTIIREQAERNLTAQSKTALIVLLLIVVIIGTLQ